MELMQNVNGQTDQIDQQNKLFEQFYNDDSLDPNTVGKGEEAPAAAAAPVEASKEPAGQPAPQSSSGSEEAEQKEVAAEQPPSQPDPNDWLSTLPEAARKHVENLAKQASLWQQKHGEQASEKRRVLNELNQLKKKVEVPKAPEPVDAEVDDVWNQLKEADPILYKALNKKLGALKAELAGEADRKVAEKLQPLEQERHEMFVQEQLGTLEHVVPNWREVTSDPYWKMWLDSQTPGTQAMFNSPWAADSIRLLKLYADDMERMFGQHQQQQPAPQQQQVAPVDPKVQQVDQARQQKLAKTAPLPAAPVGTPKAGTLTQEQMFNKFYDDPDAILALLKQTNRS